jgi:coenzyme F420-0:L-glutamate ligase/coenzyme F420-1:gamma-L-glutamate ligase
MSRCEVVNRARGSCTEKLSEEARAFASRHRVGHLATADAAGRPHVVPICYVVVGDDFYFVVDEKPKRSRRGLKRLRNIAANAQVALVIDQYDEDWGRLAFLLVQGRAGLVTDPGEYAAVLEKLRRRYPQYRDMALEFEQHPMVWIAPQRHHLWRAAAR